MDKRTIIANLLDIANKLDIRDETIYADKLTKIAEDIFDEESEEENEKTPEEDNEEE